MATFHPFPRLPFELRARIWELTIEPRVVDVNWWYTLQWQDGYGAQCGRCQKHVSSSEPAPAPLQTCRESRKELERHYQKAFSELYKRNLFQPPCLWLNPQIDIICIGSINNLPHFEPVAEEIQLLQFSSTSHLFVKMEQAKSFRFFTNIREVYVERIMDDYDLGSCTMDSPIIPWLSELEDRFWPCDLENVWFLDSNTGRKRRATEIRDEIYRELEDFASEFPGALSL